jgi:hypothetical protein
VIFVLFLWLVLAFCVAAAANSRGRNGIGWFLISILLSPIIALLLLIAFPVGSDTGSFASDDQELQRNIVKSRQFGPRRTRAFSGITVVVAILVVIVVLLGRTDFGKESPNTSGTSAPLKQVAQNPVALAQTFVPTVENEPQWRPDVVPKQWPQLTSAPGDKPLAQKTSRQKLEIADKVATKWRDYSNATSKARPTLDESNRAIKYLLTIESDTIEFPAAWGLFIKLRQFDRENLRDRKS